MNQSNQYERLEKPIVGTDLKVFLNISYSETKKDIENVRSYLEEGRNNADIEEFLQCALTDIVAICLIDGEEIGKNEYGEDNDYFVSDKFIDNDDTAGIESELGILRITDIIRINSFKCVFDGARAVHYVSKSQLDKLRNRRNT